MQSPRRCMQQDKLQLIVYSKELFDSLLNQSNAINRQQDAAAVEPQIIHVLAAWMINEFMPHPCN